MSDDKDPYAEIDRIFDTVSYLPAGTLKFELLDSALRQAETLRDEKLVDQIRHELAEIAYDIGRHRDMLTMMAHRLKYFDENRGRIEDEDDHRFDLYWHYKWLMGKATAFHQISAEQILVMVEDFGRRCREHDPSEQPVARVRRDVLVEMGRLDEAREAHSALATEEPGELSDCEACTESADIRALLWFGRYDEARALAQNFIDGRRSCGDEPQGALTRMMLPLFDAGEKALAMKCHQRSLQRVKSEPNQLALLADHVNFLVVTCNDQKAFRLLDESLSATLASQNPDDRLSLLMAFHLWLVRAAAQGKRRFRLRETRRMPVRAKSGFHDVAKLTAWVEAEIADGVTRFDARNGNDLYARKHQHVLELAERTSPLPLRSKSDAGLGDS